MRAPEVEVETVAAFGEAAAVDDSYFPWALQPTSKQMCQITAGTTASISDDHDAEPKELMRRTQPASEHEAARQERPSALCAVALEQTEHRTLRTLEMLAADFAARKAGRDIDASWETSRRRRRGRNSRIRRFDE